MCVFSPRFSKGLSFHLGDMTSATPEGSIVNSARPHEKRQAFHTDPLPLLPSILPTGLTLLTQ